LELRFESWASAKVSRTTPGAERKSMIERTLSRCSEEKSIQPRVEVLGFGKGDVVFG
jgi:hypothetical protein